MKNRVVVKGLVTMMTAYALIGCGGGGSSSGDSGQGGGATPTNTPIPTIAPTPSPSPSSVPSPTPTAGTTFDVGGSVSIAANTVNDSDINDPFSDNVDNSTFANAQLLDNLRVVNGYVTKDPTGRGNDAFANQSDADDIYRVDLQAGQTIKLQVVDNTAGLGNAGATGDIDLALFDRDANLIASSTGTGEFEEISIATSGEYFLRVFAFLGSSKYVMDLADSFDAGANASSHDTDVDLRDVIPGEAVVRNKGSAAQPQSKQTKAGKNSPSISRSRTRESLLQLNTSFATYSQQKAGDVRVNAFETELQSLNPQAYRKLKTLEEIKRLRLSGNYEYVSPNFMRKPFAIPNDPGFPRQWHYAAMNLPQAWDITTGESEGQPIIVAVVDTGVFLSHPEFNDQLVPGFDFISDVDNALDGDGIDDNPDDPGDSSALGQSSWHGTHVAATVAARTDNGRGVAGVAWNAKIMPLRALGAEGGSSYDIIQALRFAAGLENDSGTLPAQTADVINLSLGGPGSSAAENSFYQSLFDMGILVVAAAGNENSSQPSFPASYDGVFSVAATDAVGARAPYSNFGATVDIAAPGGDLSRDRTGDGRGDGVLSASVDDESGSRLASFSFQNGTSMAAPHVAGMFALMKAEYPELTPSDVDRLLQAGNLTGNASGARSDEFGYGLADALGSVQAATALANGGSLPDLPASMLASPRNANIASESAFEFSIENRGGGSPAVSSIASTETWLSVTATDIDENGLGRYQFSVDRAGLVDGTYLSRVVISFDGASDLQINVSMLVGDAVAEGTSSQLFVILVDAETEQTTDTVQATDDGFGNLSYAFTGVPPGDYIIYVGSDVDNDNFLCQDGETCGAYPTVNRITPRRIENDINDLNLLVDIFSGIGSSSTSAFSVKASGIRKLTPQKAIAEKRR